MASVLIAFGTTHGHTAKIAQVMAQRMRLRGCSVRVADTSHEQPGVELYDGVVVIASVHAGQYQTSVRRWVRSQVAELNARPAVFVSVCLGVLQKDPVTQRAVRDTVDRFLTNTGWTPRIVKSIAGALPYTRYNWFVRFLMKRIVGKAGGDTDTSRDYEYTNWDEVQALADTFAARVSPSTVERASA